MSLYLIPFFMFLKHPAVGLFTGKPSAPEQWGTADGIAVSSPVDLANGGQVWIVCWSEFGEDGRLHTAKWTDVSGTEDRLEGVEYRGGRTLWFQPVAYDRKDPWVKELKAGRTRKILIALQELADEEAALLAQEQQEAA